MRKSIRVLTLILVLAITMTAPVYAISSYKDFGTDKDSTGLPQMKIWATISGSTADIPVGGTLTYSDVKFDGEWMLSCDVMPSITGDKHLQIDYRDNTDDFTGFGLSLQDNTLLGKDYNVNYYTSYGIATTMHTNAGKRHGIDTAGFQRYCMLHCVNILRTYTKDIKEIHIRHNLDGKKDSSIGLKTVVENLLKNQNYFRTCILGLDRAYKKKSIDTCIKAFFSKKRRGNAKYCWSPGSNTTPDQESFAALVKSVKGYLPKLSTEGDYGHWGKLYNWCANSGNNPNDTKSSKKDVVGALADIIDINTHKKYDAESTTFEEWLQVAVAIHSGFQPGQGNYDADFLEDGALEASKKLTSYQKAYVATITREYNFNKFAKDHKLATGAEIKKWVNEKNKSVYSDDTSLDKIKSIGIEDDETYLARMLTFNDRLKYLMMCYTKGKAVDSVVESYYTTGQSKDIYINKFGYYVDINSGDNTKVVDSNMAIKGYQAYVYFVDTVDELGKYHDNIIDTLWSYIENGTVGSNKQYVKAIESIRSGLELINSANAWEAWTKESSGGHTMQEVYERLKEMGELTNLTDTTQIKTSEPLTQFFSLKQSTMSYNLLKGVAYSSTLIPMQSNVYDSAVLSKLDETFLKEFHYKYGFNRKALYIDTSTDAAQTLHTTGNKGSTKVCTLKDLLVPDSDIVLYIGTNFYNADKLSDILDKNFNKLDNVGDDKTDKKDGGIFTRLNEWVEDITETDVYTQLKTSGKNQYSTRLFNRVQGADGEPGYIADADSKKTNKDSIVLRSDQINNYLDMTSKKDNGDGTSTVAYDDYSVMQGYAVVSAIYRDPNYFAKANTPNLSSPVFISSPTLPGMSGSSDYEKNSIFNYMLLKNLKSNMTLGYQNNLDMNAPVYMDIYGNILTESGTVVVPAACNATLYDDKYNANLFNLGLFETYGKSYSLEYDYQNVSSIMEDAFEPDTVDNTWKVKARVLNNKLANMAKLTTANQETITAVQGCFESYLANKHYNMDKFINISLEVMRGAPIEDIRKDFEGLNTNTRVSKAGVVAASKLEELNDALDTGSENTLLSLPNPSFIDGLQYIVAFAFKIMMAVTIIILLVIVYIDTVGHQLSLRTIWKCISTVLVTIGTLVLIPTLFNATYYTTNKTLLQKETTYIAMLNLEKSMSGTEIGVTAIKEPKEKTQLLIKLADIDVPWYDIFNKVVLRSTIKTLDSVYDGYFKENTAVNQKGVEKYNDGLYIKADTLFDSADVDINLDDNNLYMRTDEDLIGSFYSPYYVILQALINNVNKYNLDNNWYNYTTKTQKGGKIKTVGDIKAYFTSTDFMESQGDILNFCEVYGLAPSMKQQDMFYDSEIYSMEKSNWYANNFTTKGIYKRINLISDYAREFISDNKELLGRITDDTFLKVMALSIAMKHNQLFGVSGASSIEIYNLSNSDLMRLAIASKDMVMTTSNLTFARFAYEVGGTPAVFASTLLSIVNFVGGYIKPAANLLVFIAIFASLFWYKVILRKKDVSLYSYLITTMLLCAANIVQSLLLKFTMYLPTLIGSPTVCVLIQCFIQILEMSIVGYVTFVAFRDFKDVGAESFQFNLRNIFSRDTYSRSNLRYKDNTEAHWNFYDKLIKKHQYRKENRLE